MKLKRIASAVMAAVMAVTSAVVCEVTAGAADDVDLVTTTVAGGKSVKIVYDISSDDFDQYDACDLIINTWDNDANNGDYIKYGIGGSGQSQWYSSFIPVTSNLTNQELTINLTQNPKDNFVVSTNENNGKYDLFISHIYVYDTLGGTGTALCTWDNPALDTTVYGRYDLGVPTEGSIFPGTFDSTKISGPNSGIEVVLDITDAWGGLIFRPLAADGKSLDSTVQLATYQKSDASTGTFKKFVKFSDFSSVPEKFGYDLWSATITSITIVNDSKTDSIYTADTSVAVTDVTLDKTTLSLVEEETATLTATVAPANATDKTVTWTSSATDVATVDSTGKVTAVKAGTATITAKAGEKTAACDVTVTAKTVYATSVTLSEQTLSLKVGGEAVLTATVLPENATNKKVSWTSDNREVATVDQNGKVTAVAPGEAQIRVSANGLNSAAGLEVCNVCMVTVSEADIPVKTVTITKPTTTEYTVGSDVTLEAKVNTDATVSDKTIKWSSSDADVASVDETTGKVTFKKAGEVTITAFYGSKSTIKDTITLVVSEPVNDDYIESPIHYDETTADAAKPINITLNGSSTNSVLYVMSVSEQDAKTYNGVKVKVLNDDGTVIKEITLDTLYQAFKFVGADNVKYIESGIAGRYFAIVRIDNVNAVGSFTVSMELVK